MKYSILTAIVCLLIWWTDFYIASPLIMSVGITMDFIDYEYKVRKKDERSDA